jgi:hypothetical protein
MSETRLVAKGPGEPRREGESVEQQRERLKADYMKLAREAVDRAKALLEEPDAQKPIYAALELRRAFEALVYENALRFTDELVGEDFAVWQPTQLLERLIGIDPVADSDLEFHMQDPASGEWLKLGLQQRISLPALKRRYYALGNHLHTPALAQMMRGRRQKRASLLKLCNECVDLIEKDLNASMRIGRMAIFGNFDIECLSCGAQIRWMLNALRTPRNSAPGTKEVIVAKCSKCPASYEIRSDGAEALRWREQRWEAECPYLDCEGVHRKWGREVKDGMESVCPTCGKKAVIAAALTFLPEAVLKAARKR